MSSAETTTLQSHDGLRLHGIRWRTTGDAKGIVLVVHGIGEHSGRYAHVAHFLAASGYNVYSLDYRGHGLSEGERANVGAFDLPVEDVKVCYEWLRAEEGDQPIFMLGHSQGTLVTLMYALRYPGTIRGIVLSAAMFGLAELAPPLVWLAKALKAVAPRAKVIPIGAETLSRDPVVLEAVKNDPLNNNQRVTPHIVHEMVRESRQVLDKLATLNKPILIMHGTGDRLVPPKGSQMVYDAIGSNDKTLKWYDGLYHEIMNEPEKEQVLADIVAWLDIHAN